MLEKDVASAIKDSLLRRGWVPFRQNSGRFRTVDGRWITIGIPGIPDYICLHPHFPGFLLETKRPKLGELSSAQITKRWELEKAYKLRVCVMDDVDDLVEWLTSYEREWGD
jgi:hypothetical protein